MVKFVTCRVVTVDTFKTLFLSSTEVRRRGAEGLLEAVGPSLTKPATPAASNDEDSQLSVTSDYDFKGEIFSKLRSISTDGESANTGTRNGLWTKLQEAV